MDTNSSYCNLLQCSHYSGTSVVAEQEGKVEGFISGYIVPDSIETLFIWQVAVADEARGQGLATKMLKHILEREQCLCVSFLETTITESNQASWALFEGLASKLNTKLNASVMFDKELHFKGQHDTELLARIGPFSLKN